MGYRIINGKPYITGNFDDYGSGERRNINTSSKGPKFAEILNNKLEKQGFILSNHAAERIKNLNLSEKDLETLNNGINRAAQKGCKNSVLVFRDIAFVASIENKTIITAVDKERVKDNVFTNVDSVLFL